MRRAGAAAEHGGDAGIESFFQLLGGDEMDMAVNPASCDDFAFTGNDFGRGADDDGDGILRIWVARLADGGDAAFLQADVGFVDAGVIDNQGVGDDGIHRALGAGGLGLPHTVADDFAAAEFYFFAIEGEVAFHFDDQVGVGEVHFVAGGRAIHLGVGGAESWVMGGSFRSAGLS